MIRNAIHRFMYGRYGSDQLNVSLLVLYLVLDVIFTFVNIPALYWMSLIPFGWMVFRLLSRNISARRNENTQFMRAMAPMIQWFRFQRAMRRDKNHRYFKCPSCGQQLRVPRGKGHITVTCRSCGASFQENS